MVGGSGHEGSEQDARSNLQAEWTCKPSNHGAPRCIVVTMRINSKILLLSVQLIGQFAIAYGLGNYSFWLALAWVAFFYWLFAGDDILRKW